MPLRGMLDIKVNLVNFSFSGRMFGFDTIALIASWILPSPSTCKGLGIEP